MVAAFSSIAWAANVEYSKLPLVFERNTGQWPGPETLLSRARGYRLLFAPGGARILSANGELRLSLVGANGERVPSARERLASVSHYYLGSDPARHVTNVPHYARVHYSNVYQGIDWAFYGKESRIEFDFIVAPGGEPERIRLKLDGAAASLGTAGELVLAEGLTMEKPHCYQETASGRRAVRGSYKLLEDGTVTFALGPYDRTKTLVIDPVLAYSTYIGGTGTDTPNGFTVDSAGNAYLAGATDSANFPVANALQGTRSAFTDAFVTKLNAQGGYVYSTYIGGDQIDRANGIAVDGSGNAYVTGITESTNYPLASAFSSTGRLVVTKLSAAGTIAYSTRIPAAGAAEARRIAVDGSGQAAITGSVFGGIPVQNAFQSAFAGGSDAFLLKLNAAGNALLFSTYYGGTGNEVGSGIASDSAGNTWVTGSTTSSNLPTSSPYQASLKGLSDAFIAYFTSAGTLGYSTYLGTVSGGGETGLGAAIDPSGRGCISGATSATDFPAINATFPGSTLAEGWVVCFNTDRSIRFSLPLQFRASSIAVSTQGRIGVAGEAPAAFQIPVLAPVQAAPADFFRDAFFTVLEASGTAAHASYLGGGEEDFAVGIGFDANGLLYIGGQTASPNFPRTSSAVQPNFGGLTDAFAAKIDLSASSCSYTVSPAQITVPAAGSSFTITVTTGGTCPWNIRLSNPYFTVSNPGATNTGSGTISVTVPQNTAITPRLGGIQLPSGEGTVILQDGTGGGCAIRGLGIGQTDASSLSTSSCRSPNRIGLRPNPPSYVLGVPAYSQLYSFQGTAGQRIAITLTSAAFDTYLYLFSPGGTTLGEDDDQGANQKTSATNSRIPAFNYITLPTTGTYYVDVTTFLENAVGAYSLRIDSEPIIPPTVTGVRFVPVVPCRVADTRNANGPFGGPIMPGGQTREFAIPSSSCGIPANARAYALNVTVVPSGPLSYLTLWPAGSNQPFVSTLNSFDGTIVANAALVPAGTNGAINVFVTDSTHVILDVNGYFVPDSTNQGLSFYTATPCRVADTRVGVLPFGAPQFTAGQSRDFAVPSSGCSIPSSAQAYSMNVTVVPPAPLAFLTAWPTGQTRPLVSTLNSFQGAVVANAAIVPAGTGGSMSVFVTQATDVILDVNGYFSPPGAANALSFYPVTPCRVADTRNANGAFGGPVMAANSTRDFVIPSSACSIPAAARAYSLNVTVVPSEPLAFLTAWPSGTTRPTVSTLNSFQGKVVANAAIVPAGSGSAISVFVTNQTHVILDINGYFGPQQ